VTPQAWAHFIQAHFRGGQAARVRYDSQTSVIAGGRAACYTMPSLPVVTAAVRSAMQRTCDTSATGDDGVGPAFIRHAVWGGTAHTPDHVLAPLLSRLFRAVLCSGHVPAVWKVARLTPLFKKGDRSDPSNDRLIAVSPVVYRLFAGVVNLLLTTWCQKQNVFPKVQFGFSLVGAANKPCLLCAILHSANSAGVVAIRGYGSLSLT
jgi:hypothetical protein